MANHTANVWQRHGWEAGWLGYPVGGEVPVKGTTGVDGEVNGWVQRFEGGRIYRSPALQGFQVASVNGLIMEKWLELGGPEGDLGYPIADEAATPDGQGRFSVFQHGSIYWHPNHGAHVIDGAISLIWKQSGGDAGPYGYPISDVYLDEEANIKQDFSGGSINLKDFFTSDETVLIEDREVSRDLINFLETYLGPGAIPGSSSFASSQQSKTIAAYENRASNNWVPAQNSEWVYRGDSLAGDLSGFDSV